MGALQSGRDLKLVDEHTCGVFLAYERLVVSYERWIMSHEKHIAWEALFLGLHLGGQHCYLF